MVDISTGLEVSTLPKCEGFVSNQAIHSFDGAKQEDLTLLEPFYGTVPSIINII